MTIIYVYKSSNVDNERTGQNHSKEKNKSKKLSKALVVLNKKLKEYVSVVVRMNYLFFSLGFPWLTIEKLIILLFFDNSKNERICFRAFLILANERINIYYLFQMTFGLVYFFNNKFFFGN